MKHPWLSSVIVLTSIVAGAVQIAADEVSLSLNLLYADPMDNESDGDWQLVAKADEQGLMAANVQLTNLFGTPQLHTPLAEVGGTPVGFEVNEVIDFGTRQELVMAQVFQAAGVQQPLFYDVGVMGGGTSPGDTGPGFTLDPDTARSIPWGMADPLEDEAWDGAVLLASGAFAGGMTPAFSDEGTTRGIVFTSVGDETTPPTIAEATVMTMVRSNLVDLPSLEGDYSDNGQVEQADLDLVLLNWGDAFDTLPAEWVNQRPTMGIVDQAELDAVLLNWGSMASAGLAAHSVPEPSTLLLVTLVVAAGWAFRRTGRGGTVG